MTVSNMLICLAFPFFKALQAGELLLYMSPLVKIFVLLITLAHYEEEELTIFFEEWNPTNSTSVKFYQQNVCCNLPFQKAE